MYSQLFILSAVLSLSSAQLEEHEHYAPKHHKFEYGVHDPHTGDIKEAEESSDGHTVTGYYKLKDADGTERIVHYTADKDLGFVAHVSKIGIPYFPAEISKHNQEPQYKIPSYASGLLSHYEQPQAEHKFHVIHDKHHAKSHQAVKIEEIHH